MARLITLEQGKTLPDAEGDVMRGLQVVEQCCSLTNLLLGETLPGVTKDMDLTSMRTPLGVCAGIAPFNFPAMIPLWDEVKELLHSQRSKSHLAGLPQRRSI